MTLTDSYKHQGLRQRMVQSLREKGISDERVLQAMKRVPRQWFIDSALESSAYEDIALPIFCDQTISQPSTVAFQSQLLDVESGMRVLEIGTGSGYQTAVLVAMGAKVWTIERQKGLYEKTRQLLASTPFHARCYLGDGYQGITEADAQQFDRIIITCGAPEVPEMLMAQLKIGGVMVIPVGGQREQKMLRIVKTGDMPITFHLDTYGNCQFVPMLEGRQF